MVSGRSHEWIWSRQKVYRIYQWTARGAYCEARWEPFLCWKMFQELKGSETSSSMSTIIERRSRACLVLSFIGIILFFLQFSQVLASNASKKFQGRDGVQFLICKLNHTVLHRGKYCSEGPIIFPFKNKMEINSPWKGWRYPCAVGLPLINYWFEASSRSAKRGCSLDSKIRLQWSLLHTTPSLKSLSEILLLETPIRFVISQRRDSVNSTGDWATTQLWNREFSIKWPHLISRSSLVWKVLTAGHSLTFSKMISSVIHRTLIHLYDRRDRYLTSRIRLFSFH